MGMLYLPVTPSIPILYARTEDNADTRQTRRSAAGAKLCQCPIESRQIDHVSNFQLKSKSFYSIRRI